MSFAEFIGESVLRPRLKRKYRADTVLTSAVVTIWPPTNEVACRSSAPSLGPRSQIGDSDNHCIASHRDERAKRPMIL